MAGSSPAMTNNLGHVYRLCSLHISKNSVYFIKSAIRIGGAAATEEERACLLISSRCRPQRRGAVRQRPIVVVGCECRREASFNDSRFLIRAAICLSTIVPRRRLISPAGGLRSRPSPEEVAMPQPERIDRRRAALIAYDVCRRALVPSDPARRAAMRPVLDAWEQMI